MSWIAVAILVIIAVGIVAIARSGNPDVRFCQGVFKRLVKSDQSVQSLIDWDHLQALDVNVAETYRQLPSDEEKTTYRETFIRFFAVGFEQTRGTMKAVRNWRVVEDRGDAVVVAVDFPKTHATLLWTVSRGGPRKIQAIAWGKAPGAT